MRRGLLVMITDFSPPRTFRHRRFFELVAWHPIDQNVAMQERDIAITFAGGGNRAFYQLGLMKRLTPLLAPRLGAIAACSAGACVATLWLAERADETHAYWIKRREGVKKNIDFMRVFSG